MHKQSLRVVLYSSIAIFLLALVWGLRQIPAQGRLAEETLRASVDQELIVLNGAVKVATQALKYRLLDVLKAEGGEHTSRTFQDSPFLAVTLLEADGEQWKTLWYSVKSKTDAQPEQLKSWIGAWPLAHLAPNETYYAKVADIQGQAYFAIVVPVRRPNQIPMVGVGLFPAAQFGLNFAADQNREIRVFDNQGEALALSHPAYLGASLKHEALAREILESDEASLRAEWKDETGHARLGVASRVPESNLVAAIETPLEPATPWKAQSWIYLILCAAGAAAVNWFLFTGLLKPLLTQLSQSDQVNESFRKKIHEQLQAGEEVPVVRAPVVMPKRPAAPEADSIIPSSQLPTLSFVEKNPGEETKPVAEEDLTLDTGVPPAAPTNLGKIVQASLRSFDPKLREQGIHVMHFGLDEIELQGDSLQLQTAIEEVLKNSLEAMTHSRERNLTVSARRHEGRIVLTVEDSGEGVAAGDVDKVFDPFFSTKDNEGVSRGLGLNVVRRVIEELGGNVKLTSHRSLEASGTRVEMDWPQAQVAREIEVAPPVALPPAPLETVELPGLEEEEDEFSVEDLAHEIMHAPLRPTKMQDVKPRAPSRSTVEIRKPKVVRTLD